MKITVTSHIPASTDALFIFTPEKKWDKGLFGALLPKEIEKYIEGHSAAKHFEGKKGEVFHIFPEGPKGRKVFLVGTGKGDLSDLRKSAGVAIRSSKRGKMKHVTFLLPKKFDPLRAVSGAILGNYEFKIGDKKDMFSPESVTVVTSGAVKKENLESEIALAEATNFTRDLVNLPPNLMTPHILAGEAKKLEKKGQIKVSVFGEKELQKMKMGALLGVGLGSPEETKVIVLEYSGGKKSEAPIAFVGKGVCFDSGGYNLKPSNHIEEMKSDMAGAATVLGLFHWISTMKPKKNIVGVIGAVENMVAGNAFKPGDILTAMNGQTIEITNTDAEGRLVLADCLYYTATKFKPSRMFNAATLTGAAIAALGNEITAIMGNNPALIARVKKAAESADEEVWELPITDFFREKIKGEISDLMNWTEGVGAGSSMGGAFLQNFVQGIPWVHFDIAGTAFHGKKGDELAPKGATGTILRTFKELVG